MSIQPHSNGHDSPHTPGIAEATCPYCGQSISRKEFREIQTRIELEERARIAKIEADLKARVAREVAKAETQAKNAVEKAKRDAARAAEQQIKKLRASQDTVISARLEGQRIQFERSTAEAVNTERAKHFDEKLKLESQLADMQRRLQAKTAHQLGEPAEVDLYEALVAAFPADRVSRVVKGVRGPDVLVEVIDHSEVVGKIVLDSKNHSRWSNKFTSKLRSDQLAEGADFAILSSSVFPAGARQLHIQDNVIVADPARVVILVRLLRRQIIQNHVLRLSSEARKEKADKLYDFVMSPVCTDIFDRLKKASDDMIDLETKEVDAHHGVWRKRGELIRSVQRVHEEFAEAVSQIIGGVEPAVGDASAEHEPELVEASV